MPLPPAKVIKKNNSLIILVTLIVYYLTGSETAIYIMNEYCFKGNSQPCLILK